MKGTVILLIGGRCILASLSICVSENSPRGEGDMFPSILAR